MLFKSMLIQLIEQLRAGCNFQSDYKCTTLTRKLYFKKNPLTLIHVLRKSKYYKKNLNSMNGSMSLH